jgi:hypothetical protein
MLKFLATGVLPVPLPSLNWSWYKQETILGQVHRRLIELCWPRISAIKRDLAMSQQLAKAA